MPNLPTITLFEETYSVDCRLRQLRNTSDPHDAIAFEEFETSLKLAILSIFRNGGIEQHKDLYERLIHQAREYDRAIASLPSSSFVEPPIAPYSETPNSPGMRKRHLRLV